jgi:hypothetical protein
MVHLGATPSCHLTRSPPKNFRDPWDRLDSLSSWR